jgi:hypothetical protein
MNIGEITVRLPRSPVGEAIILHYGGCVGLTEARRRDNLPAHTNRRSDDPADPTDRLAQGGRQHP